MKISFNKGLLVKLLIILVTLAVVYSVFWFFKLGQVEKQISRFVNENASNVSISDVSVSGFPFSQKVTIKDLRFNLPTPALNKRQVLVKNLEADAKIFQSEYQITLSKEILVYDEEGAESKLNFNSDPQITISIAQGIISKLSYQDGGYKIIDSNQKKIYEAGSSMVSVESVVNENDQITFKISVKISEIEGFNVSDIYRNAFEKRLINALKTGEIAIGAPTNPINSEDAAQVHETTAAIIESAPNEALSINGQEDSKAPAKKAIEKSKLVAKQVDAAPQEQKSSLVQAQENQNTNSKVEEKLAATKAPEEKPAAPMPAAPMPVAEELKAAAVPNQNNLEQQNSVPENPSVNNEANLANISDAAPQEVAETDFPQEVEEAAPVVVKSELSLNVEYVLTPNQIQQQNPIDIVQIQEAPLQYSKTININNFTLKDDVNEISVNGRVSIFADDSLPSGDILIKISNPSSALEKTIRTIKRLAKKVMVENEIKPVDLSGLNDSESSLEAINLYQSLLERVSLNLENIALELAEKNASSNENMMEFNIRREKNLDILINETPVREILGKF